MLESGHKFASSVPSPPQVLCLPGNAGPINYTAVGHAQGGVTAGEHCSCTMGKLIWPGGVSVPAALQRARQSE